MRERRSKRAKPCQNAYRWSSKEKKEREEEGEALPQWEVVKGGVAEALLQLLRNMANKNTMEGRWLGEIAE